MQTSRAFHAIGHPCGIQRRGGAFSLVELLVGLAILGVLAVLAVAAVKGVKERSLAVRKASDLRQIGVAMFAFAQENGGLFPLSVGAIPYGTEDPRTGRPSWQEQLDDYVGENRKICMMMTYSTTVASFKKD